ncbi:arginine deiminase [Halobacillus dabanensis]|uniref:Arginine deiminase n=1 Tax=Halobacillus dabanensis TaxID=240302 RepID=A0A1I3R9L5_HALDA|nr:arginine deiminase family protein [Halobacillus dabanensis]SFJ42740.1 arginine deiminase [Halobacillus dabanensis]
MLKPNCWNEHDELKSVIVCSPTTLSIPDSQTATDVRWGKKADNKVMRENFHEMVQTLEREGAQVTDYSTFLSEDDHSFHEQLIDRMYVRDLACVFGSQVIPGEAGTSIRRPEYVHAHKIFAKWFSEDQFLLEWKTSANALEHGDVFVLSKDAVFINVGLRSSYESALVLYKILIQLGFSEIGIIDLPRRADSVHLDMTLNVAGPGIILAKSYLRYFPVEILTETGNTYVMMHEFLQRHGFDVIWNDEIKNTAADINFINLDPETLLLSTKANKKIFRHEKLKKKRLIEINVDELESGGGGIRCMTLPVERRP